LSSLAEQSLTDLEFIIVTDGSDDDEEKRIIDAYVKKDKRFIVHNNPSNIGTGLSREKGVSISRGKYVGFLDTDDFVEPEAFKTMYECALANSSDIVIADFFTLKDDGEYYDKDVVSSGKINNYNGLDVFRYQLRRIKKPYYLRVDWWNKIYKRSLFTDYQITFPSVVRNEGTMSMIMSTISNKVSVIDTKLFHTVARQGSVCRTFRHKNIDDIVSSTKHFIKWSKKTIAWDEYGPQIINFFMFVLFNHNVQMAIKLPKEERLSALDYLQNTLSQDREIYRYLLTYLNNKERSVERLVYATICNSKTWSILIKIKETDFVKRVEGGRRLSEREKYSNGAKITTLVTICKDILSEGRQSFFNRMIESSKNQTIGRENIEHIVIDADSEDGTKAYLNELVEEGLIDYWVSESDTGIYNAMNKGPDFAYGDYILYLNSDDYISNDAVEILTEAIEDNSTDYAFANAYKVDESEKKVGMHIGDINKVYFGAPYCHQTLLVKIDCFSNVKFDENYKITMWKYALQLHEIGYTSHYIQEYLAYFRVGGISTDTKHEKMFKAEQDEIKENYIVPRLNLSYQEYEYINHFFRKWPTEGFDVDRAVIKQKIDEMHNVSDKFMKGFSVAVKELTDMNKLISMQNTI
jgi:glycosyltransferase involved in cell wall biosynthesis